MNDFGLELMFPNVFLAISSVPPISHFKPSVIVGPLATDSDVMDALTNMQVTQLASGGHHFALALALLVIVIVSLMHLVHATKLANTFNKCLFALRAKGPE